MTNLPSGTSRLERHRAFTRQLAENTERCALLNALSDEATSIVLAFARSLEDDERRRDAAVPLHKLHPQRFIKRVQGTVDHLAQRTGARHVLVASLFRYLDQSGQTRGFTLESFKEALVAAQEQWHVVLLRWRRSDVPRPDDDDLGASEIRRGAVVFHCVRRSDPCETLGGSLDKILGWLSKDAFAAVIAFARKVHDDEQRRRRSGRPRLLTLSPEALTTRVHEVALACAQDASPSAALIAHVFRALEEHGEATGLSFEAFQARLLAAHHAGRLELVPAEARMALDTTRRIASELHDNGNVYHFVRVCRDHVPVALPMPVPQPALRRASTHVAF